MLPLLTVVVAARRPDQARKEIGDVARVEISELDLADLASAERFAGQFLATDRGIDMLINNAAVMANELTRVGPGWESQFAIGHLGHFALTSRLWPALKRDGGARVVSLRRSGNLAPLFKTPEQGAVGQG